MVALFWDENLLKNVLIQSEYSIQGILWLSFSLLNPGINVDDLRKRYVIFY